MAIMRRGGAAAADGAGRRARPAPGSCRDGDPQAARKRWIVGDEAARARSRWMPGAVVGAGPGKSLLPAGVTAVTGSFGRGDPVAIARARRGRCWARGWSRYTAEEARLILGRQVGRIEAVLGLSGPGGAGPPGRHGADAEAGALPPDPGICEENERRRTRLIPALMAEIRRAARGRRRPSWPLPTAARKDAALSAAADADRGERAGASSTPMPRHGPWPRTRACRRRCSTGSS